MRVNAGLLIILSLLFVVGGVGAVGIANSVTLSSDKTYVVAGSGEQATITALVMNTSSMGPVDDGTVVRFIADDPIYGTFASMNGTTSNGIATSSFTVSTKSGTAVIRANVLTNTLPGVTNTFSQKIDHNKAYTAKFSHVLEAEVNTTTPFSISFTDYYGNPIDHLINPNQTHTISLHVYGPSPNDCYFVGYGHNINNQVVDPNGNVSVQVKLTSAAGPNSVTMDQFELIPPPSQRIITAVSSDVSSMKSTVNPLSPPGVPADGDAQFMITYILYDQYRNPAGQKEFWVNTSLGESMRFKTDNLGQVVIGYGKKINPGTVTLTATSINNPLVNLTDSVEFTSTTATTIVLSANPEIMVSRDRVADAKSNITAKITNIMGGASPGETVTFTLGSETYPGGPYNVTYRPSFSRTGIVTTATDVTDANGDATVEFYPGGFNNYSTAAPYHATATGQITITAIWTDSSSVTHTKDMLVKWKNYPYLSAKTTLSNDTIKVNETVDVTILLTADGWALQPNPIDTVLVLDRSGSMAWDSPTRISQAKSSSKTFVDQMNSARDRVGLVSFSSSTTLNQGLSNNFGTVKSNIDSMSANGATQLRNAAYTGLSTVATTGRSNAVKAIILVTDGEWNYDGNPLGKGNGFRGSTATWPGSAVSFNSYQYYDALGGGTAVTSTVPVPNGGSTYSSTYGTDVATTTNRWVDHYENAEESQQNLSVYAKNNNIRIYAITFAYQPVSECTNALRIMANSTGGFYAHAPNEAALTDLYTKIAGELKTEAGVDTAMSADFSNVNVTGVTVPGAQVFDYIYQPSVSTAIKWQNLSTTLTSSMDQSSEWASNNKLNFTIGTMKVGDTWQATFRLKVKKSGSIDMFGENSVLIFNNSGTHETLTLPHTWLTVTPELPSSFELQQIDVIGQCSVASLNKAILPVTWWTTYSGAATDIYEEANYIDETGAHVPFHTASYHVTGSTTTSRSTSFDLNTVPKGQHYDIEVRVYTTNAQDSAIACGGTGIDNSGKTFIKLE